MNFPKFWARGEHQGFTCWRWSNIGVADAAAAAREAAVKLAERFARVGPGPDRYGYADRPLREPVLRELKVEGSDCAAVVSRNSYGSVILNTARVMFVDVDLNPPSSNPIRWLARLFGGGKRSQAMSPDQTTVAQAESWVQTHPGWGWRIYRTRAGMRLLATHALAEPSQPVVADVFEYLGADPLYRRLCQAQECFRARLTPKPWRCGVPMPPARWPWRDAKAEASFNEWQERYVEACSKRATCELIAATGSHPQHAEVQMVVKIHDEVTRAQSGLPLA